MASLIGNNPDQLPTNGDLGGMAFQDPKAVNIQGGVATLDSLALPEGDLATLVNSSLAFRNKLLNATFAVNQRQYVSATNTSGANEFTLDRWKVVTSGQNISFSDSGGVRTVTAPAGGMEQVIEGATLLTGTHTLNWTGTATATVDGNAVAKGGTFSLTAGTNCTVRFTGGTVSKSQLEFGDTPTMFESRPITVEMVLCQRYCVVYSSEGFVAADTAIGLGFSYSTTNASIIMNLPCPMRITPTLSVSGAASTFKISTAGGAVTSSVVPVLGAKSPEIVELVWQAASGLTAGQCVYLYMDNSSSKMVLSADI